MNDMLKEYTIVTTVEFTDVKVQSDYRLPSKEVVEKRLDSVIDADNIHVVRQQVFERDKRLVLSSSSGNA